MVASARNFAGAFISISCRDLVRDRDRQITSEGFGGGSDCSHYHPARGRDPGPRSIVPAAGIRSFMGLGTWQRSAAGGHPQRNWDFHDADGAWVLDGFITHANKPVSTGIGLDGGGCGCDYFFAVALDMDDLASALVALAALVGLVL